MYNNPIMHIFAGIFVSGGFLITFGQFVPSWDSAVLSINDDTKYSVQRILSSKWWLMVIATIVTTLVIIYLYFDGKRI
jgi:hypothetical protein